MDINSVECIQLYFRLDWACGRTCKVERKGLGPILGQRFHAATKVLVVAQELAKAKRYELMAKS